MSMTCSELLVIVMPLFYEPNNLIQSKLHYKSNGLAFEILTKMSQFVQPCGRGTRK